MLLPCISPRPISFQNERYNFWSDHFRTTNTVFDGKGPQLVVLLISVSGFCAAGSQGEVRFGEGTIARLEWAVLPSMLALELEIHG